MENSIFPSLIALMSGLNVNLVVWKIKSHEVGYNKMDKEKKIKLDVWAKEKALPFYKKAFPILEKYGYIKNDNPKKNFWLLPLSIFLSTLVIAGVFFYLVVFQSAFTDFLSVNNTQICPANSCPNCPACNCPECNLICPDINKISCGDVNLIINGSVES